ncbi:unnamed protein product [Rotaria socialis]|uniref:Uncharacterized protein n=1 Tax=Rotaria socialis TaxID=392032 RepID=A0A818XL30_9BILA|nr:unnamed protein product [Rotaria socialis]CAF4586565.1 unnamed protein product [Rotaria socialis]
MYTIDSASSLQSIRILYIPPYYENHLELAFDRLRTDNKNVSYQIYTIDRTFSTSNLNFLLSMCRTVINEEHIQMLVTDSSIGQLVVAKLCQEYPQISNGGMNFLNTLHCISRLLITELFDIDECIPTVCLDIADDSKTNLQRIETFLSSNKIDGYIKSLYSYDNESSSFRFSNWSNHKEIINNCIERYKQQFMNSLLPLFRVYVSKQQYPSVFKPSYLVQPFFDLVTYPHWRMVIANCCIYDKEIIMWPLVDGYSGWPFLAEKPLAIMPIIICPSRQISNEQQNIVYARFRKHVHHLIKNYHLRHGWIQCSYFISCTNEIRLVSMKPTWSVYLTEGFNSTNEYGNPIMALVQLANRQRPQAPVLNGRTAYIHRLWMNIQEKHCINDLIDFKEIKRIQRTTNSLSRYVRLRFQDNDMINNDNERQNFIDCGFIQVNGDYYEMGLTNLIEFRYKLLKKSELFPFVHHSMLSASQSQFDPITCLPTNELITQLEKLRQQEHKDLI